MLLPPGSDFAAHEYQLSLFVHHGWTFWDNFWYGGRYTFVTYSVLYYPLAALLGIKLLAVAGIAVAAAAFTWVTARQWGNDAIWASRVFAIVWASFIVTAAFPFALGVTLGALAIAAAQKRARWHFAGLALLTLLASPLAFVLLVIVLVGAFVAQRRPHDAGLIVPLAALGACEFALWQLFPDPGRYPFPRSQFAAAAAFCILGVAATWGVDRARPLLCIFLAYLVACSVAFALPSAVGENIARLRFVALPVAVLALSIRGWRPRVPAVGLLVLAALWNLIPLGWTVDRSAGDTARTSAYWADTTAFLQERLTPDNRVEVVDTASHWASYYLARRHLALARGWYRQDDFPQNAALYGDLTAPEYLEWLHHVAVRFVVLPDAELDYSARGEAKLLRSSANPLPLVARFPHVTVFAVPDPRSIVVGPYPAHVVVLTPRTIGLKLGGPGRYRIAVRFSPYWRAEHACVSRTKDGDTALWARSSGHVTLAFDIGLDRMFSTLVDSRHTCAAAA